MSTLLLSPTPLDWDTEIQPAEKKEKYAAFVPFQTTPPSTSKYMQCNAINIMDGYLAGLNAGRGRFAFFIFFL